MDLQLSWGFKGGVFGDDLLPFGQIKSSQRGGKGFSETCSWEHGILLSTHPEEETNSWGHHILLPVCHIKVTKYQRTSLLGWEAKSHLCCIQITIVNPESNLETRCHFSCPMVSTHGSGESK